MSNSTKFVISLFLLCFTKLLHAGGPYSLVAPSTDTDGNFVISWSMSQSGYDEDIFCKYLDIKIESTGILVDSHSNTNCTISSYAVSGLSDGTYDISLEYWEYDEGDIYLDYTLTAQTVVGSGTSSIITILEQDFESGLGWQNTGSEDWYRDSYGTPSGNTGPSGASEGTYYAYMETSSCCAYTEDEEAFLTSPSFDPSNGTLTFDYHMYGYDIGTLTVKIHNNGQWHTIWSKDGAQHSSSSEPWKTATVSLASFSGASILRFEGKADGGYRGDIAIDNINVYIEPQLISQLNISDSAFLSCIQNEALSNGWTYTNEVTTLFCVGDGIGDISGIGIFENLENLYLGDNFLSDISALNDLDNLKLLNVASYARNNQIYTSQIASIKGMDSIENLTVFNFEAPNRIQRQAFEGGFSGLNFLRIYGSDPIECQVHEYLTTPSQNGGAGLIMNDTLQYNTDGSADNPGIDYSDC